MHHEQDMRNLWPHCVRKIPYSLWAMNDWVAGDQPVSVIRADTHSFRGLLSKDAVIRKAPWGGGSCTGFPGCW